MPALVAIGVMLFAPASAHAQVIRYVDQSASPGGNGQSWPTAYLTLQQALADTAADEIWVAQGTYTPAPPNGPRTSSFKIEGFSVDLYGGFNGTETALNQRNPCHYPTILSGDLNANDTPSFGNRSDNVHHVLSVLSTQFFSAAPRIDGFTISGGNASDETASVGLQPGVGAGILVKGGSGLLGNAATPEILRCIFQDNLALSGAGLYIAGPRSANINVRNCIFRTNNAMTAAAIYIDDAGSIATATVTSIVNCQFNDNTSGGAIYCKTWPFVSILQSTFSRNPGSALITKLGGPNQGGGSSEGSLAISNSIIFGNTTTQVVSAHDDRKSVNFSCIQSYISEPGETGNITSDPLFLAPTDADFRIDCASPCSDTASSQAVAPDTYNLNQGGGCVFVNNLEPNPDLDLRCRAHDSDGQGPILVDMGAHQHQLPYSPYLPCLADIDDDGIVEIDDLTTVILQWSPVPPAPPNCPPCSADITPAHPCLSDDRVDIDDLTLVILNWGMTCSQCSFSGVSDGDSFMGASGAAMMAAAPAPGDAAAAGDAADDADELSDLPSLTDILYNLPAGSSIPPDALQALLDLGIQP